MPGSRPRAAAIQLNSGSNAERNWTAAESLIRAAAEDGAELIATPENTNFLGPHEDKVRLAESLDGPTCQRFAGLAEELGVFMLLGSFNERLEDPGRCANTSVLFGPDGARLAAYRKIHLFDVDLSDEVRFRESDTVIPGTEPIVAATDLGRLGLSICYDLRFPGLYGCLRTLGAEILFVPAAFTRTTGRVHWETLLRARAVETQCWVVAPAQCGRHDDEGLRESWGHSAIVDPWGEVVVTAGEEPDRIAADLDLERLRSIRASMPVEEHRRFDVVPRPAPEA